jgi:hypothetical protein
MINVLVLLCSPILLSFSPSSLFHTFPPSHPTPQPSLVILYSYILSIMFIATELSTPFVNLRWHLLHTLPHQDTLRPALNGGREGGKAGGKDGKPTNGEKNKNGPKQSSSMERWMRLTDVAMVVVFGLCRVLALPFQFQMVVRHVLSLGRVSRWWVSVQCGVSFFVIGFLNVWWFGKMLALLKRGGRKGGKEEE